MTDDPFDLRLSMTLFETVANDPAPFAAVIERYYSGERDTATLERL